MGATRVELHPSGKPPENRTEDRVKFLGGGLECYVAAAAELCRFVVVDEVLAKAAVFFDSAEVRLPDGEAVPLADQGTRFRVAIARLLDHRDWLVAEPSVVPCLAAIVRSAARFPSDAAASQAHPRDHDP